MFAFGLLYYAQMAELDRRSIDTSDGTDNGWKNFPTRTAYSWLSSHEPTYRIARAIVGQADTALHGGEGLRTWVQENNPLADEPSLYADILGWAIQAIDWAEVATAFAPDSPLDMSADDTTESDID
jgi:hypothetical protein